jgi:alpha-mannosidase
MIKEVLLVHHSHTDIGYTHPQPVVRELHHRFIETALDLADSAKDDRDDSRFRWTCEVTGTTRAWWSQASVADRDRFLAAVRRGQIEVAALEWHLTPLADLRMLVASLENVQFFRDLGIPIRSAMNTDVNGVPWGLVDVLLDHGIDGFSMSSNSHFGAPVTPRPGAFRWVSPDGRKLLVWNGFQYWHFANVLAKMPSSVEAVAEALPPLLQEAELRGYSLPFLPIQITNPHHPDNAAPDANIGPVVRAWNDRNLGVRIRTVLLSELFDLLRTQELPEQSGDWTDYWNFGAGSSARETGVFLEGLRVLDAAHQVGSWPAKPEAREAEHLSAAHAQLALYAEHTWGADCSISAPKSIETHLQWALKSATAYEGLAHARIVLRDGLHRLAERAGGEDPTLLLYNPLPVAVKLPMLLPVDQLSWPLTPGIHHVQRIDGALDNLPESAKRWCDVEIPALGYRTYRVESLAPASSSGLRAEDNAIASDRIRIEFSAAGGVSSLQADGVEYAGEVEGLKFGVPILERPVGGSRREIMKLDFGLFEPAEGWIRDWERTAIAGRLVSSESRSVPGAVEFRQLFEMTNGDRVAMLYRLFAEEGTVDVEAILDSTGDARPYSIVVPFTLPESGDTVWHFDTAGAVVEFDREQLPNACRHFVTTRRFVRMQTANRGLTVATPDLPLWKFGGNYFAPSDHLSAFDRRPVMLAWLANNYWEVNFLANQSGRSRSRFRLIPHAPEEIDISYARALPYAVPASLHAYREMGAIKQTTDSLLKIEGAGVILDSITHDATGILATFLNLRQEPTEAILHPAASAWTTANLTTLAGTPKSNLAQTPTGGFRLPLPARALVAVRLA